MAFPQTAAPTETFFGSNATAHLVTMPPVVNAGDLLLVFFSNDGTATVADPSGWNPLGSTDNTAMRFSVYYKIAVGNEDGTTVDFVTSVSEKAAAQVYRVTAWHGTTPPEISTAATGTTANPDPATLSPSWGAADTLWFASFGSDGTESVSVYPTDYLNGVVTTSATANDSSTASARRELNATSDDPSAFTMVLSEQWVAYTVAVRPAAGGTAHTATQTDPEGLTDAVTAVSAAVRSQTDPAGLTDDVTYQHTLPGVLYDAESESEQTAPFTYPVTWTHTPVGTPKGVYGVCFRGSGSGSGVTAVTYGGVALTLVATALDTAGEFGCTEVYYLGSGIPTGAQTVSFDGTLTGVSMHFAVLTVTAGGDTDVLSFAKIEADQADPQIAIDSGAVSTLRIAAIRSGQDDLTGITEVANTTRGPTFDVGNQVSIVSYQDAPSSGSFTIGWTALIDDVAMVAVAIREVAAAKILTNVLGLLDSLTALQDAIRVVIDPLGLVDDAARVADNVRTQTDPAGLTDDATYDHTVGGTGIERTVTDPLGLLDAAAGTSTLERDQTDPVGLTDTVVPVTDSERSQTDPLGLLDAAIDELSGAGEVSITDPLGLADSGSAELVNDADPLGLTDSVEVVNGRSLTDPLGLTDSVETVGDTARSLTDPLGLLDTVDAVTDSTRSLTDPLGLTDDVTYDLTAGGVAHTATITDSLGLADSVTTAATYDRTQSDPLGLVDSVATTGTFERSLTDPLGLTDSIVVDSTGAHARQADDVLGLTDDITVSHVIGAVDYTATVTDVLSLLDSETFTATYDQTVTDLLGLDDDLATQLTGPGFWELDPAGYTANPAGYIRNPAAYVPVGPDDTPPSW